MEVNLFNGIKIQAWGFFKTKPTKCDKIATKLDKDVVW